MDGLGMLGHGVDDCQSPSQGSSQGPWTSEFPGEVCQSVSNFVAFSWEQKGTPCACRPDRTTPTFKGSCNERIDINTRRMFCGSDWQNLTKPVAFKSTGIYQPFWEGASPAANSTHGTRLNGQHGGILGFVGQSWASPIEVDSSHYLIDFNHIVLHILHLCRICSVHQLWTQVFGSNFLMAFRAAVSTFLMIWRCSFWLDEGCF